MQAAADSEYPNKCPDSLPPHHAILQKFEDTDLEK
jgi:hypothetical protein